MIDDLLGYLDSLNFTWRITAFFGLAALTHLSVIILRHSAAFVLHGEQTKQFRKLKSVLTLTTSAVIFSLYFFAVGLVLREMGVSLTSYLASATVVGLAIGFGLQGVVQDVVTGLTFIFSDLIDVGDLVEISGQTGVVVAITMRFVELENSMGASVFIPNRTINNVVNYPRGYVRCIVDVTLCGSETEKEAMAKTSVSLANGAHEQFAGILMTLPAIEGRIKLISGKEILRIKFRIWPNRGQPIETTFVQELASALKSYDATYQNWMIAISYEVEKRIVRAKKTLLWKKKTTLKSN